MVDDESGFLHSTVSMLREKYGQDSVLGTPHPKVALDWIREMQVSVLITDMRMPEVSGLELIAEARSYCTDLPVIVITAFSNDEIERGAEQGNFRFLPKPFPFSSLAAMVENILRPNTGSTTGGKLAVMPVAELVQLFASSDYEGILHITREPAGPSGRVCIRATKIVHAEVGDRQGRAAFYEMCEWSGGDFEWCPGNCEANTMDVPAFELLLDAPAPADTTYEDVDEDGPAGLGETTDPFEVSGRTTTPATGVGAAQAEQSSVDGRLDQSNAESPFSSPPTTLTQSGMTMANNVNATLEELSSIDGFIAAALVDADSGMSLGTIGGNDRFDIDVAAATNTEVVKAKMRAAKKLELKDGIDDILITLDSQYHLIRPLNENPHIFFYLALDRDKSNLAMSRMSMASAEKAVEL
jgi:CheY-like chemotaxis protein